MSKRANFWVGLVVGTIVAAAILFSMYYVPRRGLTFGHDPITFGVVLDDASGLRAGSPVLILGLEAGEVTAVAVREVGDLGHKILANVEIYDGEQYGPMLTTRSVYQVAQSGLLGETVLAISPGGDGEAAAGKLVSGALPPDLDAMLADLAQISKRAADFMDGREPGDPNLRRALVDLQATVRDLREFVAGLPKF